MAVEHDCLGVEQDMKELYDDYDVALKLLEMTQQVFGAIVRGKDHDGGNLMHAIDKMLATPSVKQRLKLFDAVARLNGTWDQSRPLTYIDPRAAKLMDEARDTIIGLLINADALEDAAKTKKGGKQAIEQYLAGRRAANELADCIKVMLRDTGHS